MSKTPRDEWTPRVVWDPRRSPKRDYDAEIKRKSLEKEEFFKALRPSRVENFHPSEETLRKEEEQRVKLQKRRRVLDSDKEDRENVIMCKKFRQQEMFEEADKEEKVDPRSFTYFCRENDSIREYFAVRALNHFWDYYRNRPKKHYYELMRENTHCHLYFDVEFSKVSNPDVDGESLVDLLLKFVVEELRSTPEVDMSYFQLKEHVVELDSTSESKFSRHLIIQLPGDQVFANNSHCAHFVSELWKRLDSSRAEDEECDALFLRRDADDVERTLPFVDLGVYTRNRVFRLYLSSKFSANEKKPALKTTGRFWQSANADPQKAEFETFKRSLASFTKTIVAPKLIAFEGVSHTSVLRGKVFQGYRTGSHLTRSAAEFNGNSCGPCPRTAAFVCEDFNRWSGLSGANVRSWTAFPEYGVLVLNLFGNRFCENVERAHKSNNVMFIVDFRESAYYQRCHDPDCRGARGPWHELGEDVLDESHNLLKMLYEPPSFDDISDEELAVAPTFDTIDDDEILAAAL